MSSKRRHICVGGVCVSMRWTWGKHLWWAECDNKRVRGRGPEGVAVPTHQILLNTPPSTGHRPQNAHFPPHWLHGTQIFKLPLHRPYDRISPRSLQGCHPTKHQGRLSTTCMSSQAWHTQSDTSMRPHGFPKKQYGSRSSGMVTTSPGHWSP